MVSEEDGGATLVFKEHETSPKPPEESIKFQIFITPFGEEETLSEERIKKDIPSAVIEHAQPVILNPDAERDGEVQALLFSSQDEIIGKTIEVWFTKNGYLYEVTAPAHMDDVLPKILSSWRSLKL